MRRVSFISLFWMQHRDQALRDEHNKTQAWPPALGPLLDVRLTQVPSLAARNPA